MQGDFLPGIPCLANAYSLPGPARAADYDEHDPSSQQRQIHLRSGARMEQADSLRDLLHAWGTRIVVS
ncbi:hypothetical protein F6X39_32000 [Paraburkholderia sp. UCT2]|nr:hypothetical protein [Paraburkholderia sp. UCT2]